MTRRNSTGIVRPILVVLLLLAPGASRAVEAPLESAVAFELGGEGLMASLHYENLVLEHAGRHRVLARVGFGYAPLFVNGEPTAGNLIVPVGVHYLLGFGAHHLEVGVAAPLRIKAVDLPGEGNDETLSLSFVPSIGYRYEDFADGCFFVGAAYSPRLARGLLGLSYSHFARLSVGARF